MKTRWKHLLFALCFLIGFSSTPTSGKAAAPNPPPGPDRYSTITVDYTKYTWWLVLWENDAVVCKVYVDHDDKPTPNEVFNDCGEKIYYTWMDSKPCTSMDKSICEGFYIIKVAKEPAKKEVTTKLPAPLAWVSIEGCEYVTSASTHICDSEPRLIITGQEPLSDYNIIRVAGTIDGEEFSCDDAVCVLTLGATPEKGSVVKFWVYSSYGDSSEVFSAKVRVTESDEGDPDQFYWYIDVLSSQWRGAPVATCADSWGSFPPVGGPPEWLTTPTDSEDLSSDIPYTYLAANLILQGAVDASECPDGGIAPGNVANTCGLEKARSAVTDWQNQFDDLILATARQTGVPAHLLKNLFARESQFWPAVFNESGDAGLGQLTENGADTTLLWNPSFYVQFCPLVLPSETCGSNYLKLSDDDRQLLRRALISSVNASCEECPLGLDLSRAEFSVAVFAQTLLANCEQAGRIVRNVKGRAPGDAASYEDMWKFTLTNYNAGPGCIGEAIQAASSQGNELTWDNVAPFLAEACDGAIDYVGDISK